jgi:hypothetical protein
MRKTFFRDLPPLTEDEVRKPLALEERTFILNERLKEIGRARIRIDKRIIAAERRESVARTGT